MLDVYDKLPVCHDIDDSKIRTKDVVLDDQVQFSSLLLEEQIQQGLAKCGYKILSPIQKNALPLVLTGTSIIAHAKSGTGKTLIYLLAALDLYLKLKPNAVFALILVPTREIAKQIYDVCKNISCFIKDLKVEYFIGGISLDIDVIKCKSCHIAVGAPGRVKHLIELGELKTQNLRLLVLDEVDALVNNREFHINTLVTALPTSRQTIVCTATYSENIGALLDPIATDLKYVNMNEQENEGDVALTSNVLLGIKQFVAPVFSDTTALDSVRKRSKLMEILKNFQYDQCFIFVNYISLVKSVYSFLMNSNLSVLWISSEQNQSARIATFNKLKMSECKILVTTDLAARGIDVHDANLVINLGIPTPPDVYLHRMGRAGRYGSEGSVITIIEEGEEMKVFEDLVSYVITEPVTLHLMPRDINAATLTGELQKIECKPRECSARLAEFIAKQEAKMEGNRQPNESKNKRRKNRKRKAKEKTFKKISQPPAHFIRQQMTPPEIPNVSTPMPIESSDLRILFNQYLTKVQNEISKRMNINASSLLQLLMPAKTATSDEKLNFNDYYQEMGAEKECDLIKDNTTIENCWIELADFVREKNKFLDEQRIPCSLVEFFTSMVENGRSKKKSDTSTVGKLTKDVLEKIRELAAVPPVARETDTEDSSITRATFNWQLQSNPRVSSSTSDSQEPPTKFRPAFKHGLNSKRIPTEYLMNPVACLSEVRPASIFNSMFMPVNAPFIAPRPSVHGSVPMFPTRVPELERARVPHNPYVPIRWTTATTPNETGNNVECPKCQHKFRVKLKKDDTESSSPPHMPTLTPYVTQEVEQEIYQSHFNYISNYVRRNES